MAQNRKNSHNGLLVLDKPYGWTSREAVNKTQRSFPRKTRIGHAGTLDPLATGTLVLCVGNATRLIEYIQRMDKEYVTDFILGAESTTQDREGQITATASGNIPSEAQVKTTLQKLVGNISQIPPAFSAAKTDGKRAYEVARKGKQVDLQPREVRIYQIEILSYCYPQLGLRIRCGKGTYIRSIARDLGEMLECGAYVDVLRRTRVGAFGVEMGLDPQKFVDHNPPELLPIEMALSDLPQIQLSEDETYKVCHGQVIPRNEKFPDKKEISLFQGGELIGVGRYEGAEKCLWPTKIFTKKYKKKGER